MHNKKTITIIIVSTIFFTGCIPTTNIEEDVKALNKLNNYSEEQKNRVEEMNDEMSARPGEVVNYSGKELTSIGRDILSRKKATKLVLSNNLLKSLPSEIGQLTEIEELYLDYNMLTGALPAEIRQMTKLKKLSASNNNLTGIPAEIGQLQELEEVDFSNNNLDTFPNEIGNLKNLKVLNIKGNKYSQDAVSKLRAILPSTNIIY